MQVEYADDDRGRRVAVKRAESAEEAARLRREADLLEVATHPALVEVVAFDDGAETVLQTAFIAGPSLTEGQALDVDEVAGVVAAVASTLADLHGMGLVHGSVALDHVLLDDDGRPVLCSLGRGGLVGERSTVAGPVASADAPVLDPAVDVFGLGVVLAALLARANGRGRGAAGDALRRLADRATAPAAADRPPARKLADEVHDAVPAARLPRGRGPASPAALGPDPLASRRRQRPLESWRRDRSRALSVAPRRRLRTLGVALVAAAVAVAGAGLLLAVGGPASTAAGPPVEAEPVATTSAAAPATATTMAATTITRGPALVVPARPPTGARANCPDVEGPLAADVDGDGCAEALRYINGVVEAGGSRWAVGEPDDVVAVGDWACTGGRSLAVLRPRTGEVFAFDGWATANHDVDAPVLAQVAGGRALRAADLDADGCNELVVERSSGAPAVLRAPRVRP